MANVSFEGEGNYGGMSNRPGFARPVTGIPALLIKWHLAKDEKQASVIQIGIIVVSLLLSIYFFSTGGTPSSSTTNTIPLGPEGALEFQ